MLNNKIRTAIVALVGSLGFAAAAAVPAVSQAQWHNLCSKGHCTEHSNYTYGNPCTQTSSPFSPGEPSKEEKEGEVHQNEIEKSFYGCDSVAPSTSGGSSQGGGTVAASPSVTATPVRAAL